MRTKTRRMTLAAIFMALAVALCYIASISQMMSLTIVALSGLITAAAVIECGIGYACLCFAGAAILGGLLVPDKSVAIFYITFFGYYPITKSLVERMRSRVLEFIIKEAVFLAVVTAYLFLLWTILFPEIEASALTYAPIVYVVAAVFLLCYDYAMTKVIALYQLRLSKYFNRDGR